MKRSTGSSQPLLHQSAPLLTPDVDPAVRHLQVLAARLDCWGESLTVAYDDEVTDEDDGEIFAWYLVRNARGHVVFEGPKEDAAVWLEYRLRRFQAAV